MPPLINLLRGNAVKHEHLRQVCDMLKITTTPKTIKLDMQTAIDELVKTYPDYETQVREMINKLVTESKKQKTESTPKLNEMDGNEVPENVLSPSAPEFHPLPTPPPTQPPASSALPPTSPPKTQQPTSIDTQQSLFDPTQKEISFHRIIRFISAHGL